MSVMSMVGSGPALQHNFECANIAISSERRCALQETQLRVWEMAQRRDKRVKPPVVSPILLHCITEEFPRLSRTDRIVLEQGQGKSHHVERRDAQPACEAPGA